MPAAAVIPAPIAYINAVAVKKLVVEFQVEEAQVRLSGCVPLFSAFCPMVIFVAR